MSDHRNALQALSTESLANRAYEQLRAAIISGQLVAGEVYSAPKLAAQLGISPTPVREAMLALANEGLFAAMRNKGFRVVALTDRDMDDVLEVRLLLELPVTLGLAGKLSADAIDELRGMAEAIVAAAARRDVLDFLETDRRFHLALLAHGGNQRLIEIVGHLRDQVRLYGLQFLAQDGALMESALEHMAILDAIAAGDRTSTESLTRAHLQNTRGIWASAHASPGLASATPSAP